MSNSTDKNTWMVIVIRRPPGEFMPMVRYRNLSCKLATSLAFDLSSSGEFIGSFTIDSSDKKQNLKLHKDIDTMRQYYDLVSGRSQRKQRRDDAKAS